AGERRVELTTTFDNQVADHRLRALVHAPLCAERLDAHQGLAVIARPLDPAAALGAGTERAAPTGQHHLFVDISDGVSGVALESRGLPEHEVLREEDRSTRLALTLLRAVGWLSRGDLSVIDHAAGPMIPTPGAQEPGLHRFEYALVLHEGDYQKGRVLADAQRFAAPATAVTPKGKHPVSPRPLVELGPETIALSALYPSDKGGTVVRILNASPEPSLATLTCSFPLAEAIEIDPLEQPLQTTRLERKGASLRLPLRPWELATILLRSKAC
ncbi:MAG: glycosyl hydrolase-related protein, partial [Polyangia bacterium]